MVYSTTEVVELGNIPTIRNNIASAKNCLLYVIVCYIYVLKSLLNSEHMLKYNIGLHLRVK